MRGVIDPAEDRFLLIRLDPRSRKVPSRFVLLAHGGQIRYFCAQQPRQQTAVAAQPVRSRTQKQLEAFVEPDEEGIKTSWMLRPG
jgi:hypothetical protein